MEDNLENDALHHDNDQVSQERTGVASHAATLSIYWKNVESAFNSRVTTGTIINTDYIDPRKFLEDAKVLVFPHITEFFKNQSCIKVNTIFYGEFTVNDKSDEKSLSTENVQLFCASNLNDWYDKHVVSSILALIEDFQEMDSGWALTKILNLMLNINKCNPMHAGCCVDLPETIKKKKAVINVEVKDNTCFPRSIVAKLHPAKNNVSRPNSYPDYNTVLDMKGITLPVRFDQIPKFEEQNDVSINIYLWNENVESCAPFLLTANKRDNHVNLIMVETPEDNVYHFALINNLSRLVSSQTNKHKGKLHICDRFVSRH